MVLIDEKWLALAVVVAATVAIDAVYLSTRSFPLKFLVPGTVFLLAFQVAPIVYNVNIAFTNWSTGHIATKDEAIVAIQRNSLAEAPGRPQYVMAPARDEDGDLVLLLVDEATGEGYVGTRRTVSSRTRRGAEVWTRPRSPAPRRVHARQAATSCSRSTASSPRSPSRSTRRRRSGRRASTPPSSSSRR